MGALTQQIALAVWQQIKVTGTRAAFLAARAAYAKRLSDEGATDRQVVEACNFQDAEHVRWTLETMS